MKIIDLLNKISEGEEVPKKIKYNDEEFTFTGYDSASQNYHNELEDLLEVLDGSMLNDEVEILDDEEKELPEKLPIWFSLKKGYENDNIQSANTNFKTMYETINEIIDYLESKGV